VQSSLLSFCNEVSATFARLLAYIGVLALLAAVAARVFGVGDVEAAIDPSERSPWIAIERPHPAFALTVPELGEAAYAMHRHPAGGGRKDIMTWGEPESLGSRLMVEIYRPGGELVEFADARSEITTRTAELGATTRLKPAEPVETKFGRTALVDFVARRQNRTRHCLGFVRAFEEPRLQIAGWYCKGNDEIIDRNYVACTLDRLAVIAAGSDPKVAELFSHAELRRKFCDQPVRRGATIRRTDWLSAAREPKLRGRHAAW
jgi:hypothetical protein